MKRTKTLGSTKRASQSAFVIKELVFREIKRKYARSYLGVLWSVLQPLLYMVVLSLVFSSMFQRNIQNFPVYLLTGITFWNLFSGATTSAMTALVDNKNLLIKAKLPMQVFPLTRCFTALVNFGYSMVSYVLILLLFRIPLHIYMPFIFLYAALLFLFAVGIGYFLAVFYVFFGDIKHLYSVVLMLWMYLSAIFYPVERVSPFMQEVIIRNPVYNYIRCARKCILDGVLPTPNEWARLFVWGIVVYICGQWYFHRMRHRVLQRV